MSIELNSFKPLLELELHLVDGTARHFFQNDPLAARQILEQIGGGRAFQQPSLVLNGPDSVFTCSGANLNRIDFRMEPLPIDLLPLFQTQGIELWEISEAEWRERYHPETDHSAQRAAVRPGDRVVAYSEVHLLDGQRFFFEQHLSAVSGIEQRNFLHNLSSARGFTSHRRGGGLSAWNVARVMSSTFYPGPPHVPSTAWAVEAWPGTAP